MFDVPEGVNSVHVPERRVHRRLTELKMGVIHPASFTEEQNALVAMVPDPNFESSGPLPILVERSVQSLDQISSDRLVLRCSNAWVVEST
jgi:hypothetical protein